MNGQTNYYLERENTKGTYGGYVLMNLGATYKVTRSVSVDLQLKNITNRYYEYVWYDNFFWGGDDQAMFSPAPGRSTFVSLNLKL